MQSEIKIGKGAIVLSPGHKPSQDLRLGGAIPEGLRRYTGAVRAEPVTVCLVGTGRIADEHLAALRRRVDLSLVGVCDVDDRLADRAARLFGSTAFTDLEQMLSRQRPRALHITTPPHTHVELARKAIAAGCELVVIEKPAALDAAALQQLLTVADRAGVTLVEDQSYRFNAPVRLLTRLLNEGRLGSVRSVDVRMSVPLAATRYEQRADRMAAERLPGGVLHEFLPHLSYLATTLLPNAVLTNASWEKRDSSTTVTPDYLEASATDEEGCGARIVFESGVSPSTTTLTVRGTHGWASADLQLASVQVSRSRGLGPDLDPVVDLAVRGVQSVSGAAQALVAKLQGSPIYEGVRGMIDATYDAVAAGTAAPVSALDMVAAAQLTDAIVAARR